MREMELEAFATLVFSTGAMSASVTFHLPLIALHLPLWVCVPLYHRFFYWIGDRETEQHLLYGILPDAPSHCSVNTSKVPQTDPFLTFLLSLSHSFTRHVNIVTSIAFSNSQDWRHLFCRRTSHARNKEKSLPEKLFAKRHGVWLLHTQNCSKKRIKK